MPAYVFAVSAASLLLQAYLPLCSEDDEYVGQTMITPRLGHAALFPEGPTQWGIIPVKSTSVTKDAVLELKMKYESCHEPP